MIDYQIPKKIKKVLRQIDKDKETLKRIRLELRPNYEHFKSIKHEKSISKL